MDDILEEKTRQDDFSYLASLHKGCFPFLYRLNRLDQDIFHLLTTGKFKHPRIKKNFTLIGWIMDKMENIQNHIEKKLIRLKHKLKYKRYPVDKEWKRMAELLEILTVEQRKIMDFLKKFVTLYKISQRDQDMEAERIKALDVESLQSMKKYNDARLEFEKLFKDFNFTKKIELYQRDLSHLHNSIE
ncbi:hypothetical protein ACFL35_00115 [Candidatus Riflebacteria bacterium]